MAALTQLSTRLHPVLWCLNCGGALTFICDLTIDYMCTQCSVQFMQSGKWEKNVQICKLNDSIPLIISSCIQYQYMSLDVCSLV